LQRPRIHFTGLVAAAGAVVFASTLIGFAGGAWWVFDLFSHFRVQYLLSIVLIIVVLLLCRKFRTSAVLAICAVLNLAVIAPYYVRNKTKNDSGTPAIRAMSFNVNTANTESDRAKQFILENGPDIVLLVEVNRAWVTAMDALRSTYPYSKSEPREDNFGIAFYSKIPFSRCEIAYLGITGVPSVIAEFEIAGKTLSILGTHPLPPIDRVYSYMRNNQLEALGQYLAAISGPKLLIGDLNTSPWSYHFGALLRTANLTDGSRGMGIHPTWPTHMTLLRIPIDFCLVSPEIVVTRHIVGPNIGSDHFPLLVDFAIQE
jgi:endonuclease/exonuclease/phosphatase (EEP) superfamily protein YafD